MERQGVSIKGLREDINGDNITNFKYAPIIYNHITNLHVEVKRNIFAFKNNLSDKRWSFLFENII